MKTESKWKALDVNVKPVFLHTHGRISGIIIDDLENPTFDKKRTWIRIKQYTCYDYIAIQALEILLVQALRLVT